jgi:hypothetical protein
MNLAYPQKHPYGIQSTLSNKLDIAMDCLKSNDYKDFNSQVYRHLVEFIDMAKDKSNKLEEYPFSKLVKLAESLKDKL